MLQNALLTGLKAITRNRLNTVVVLLSLSLSFAFSNILISYVLHESGTDSFQTRRDRIYQVFSDDPFKKGEHIRYVLRDAVQFMNNNFPEIEQSCNIAALPAGSTSLQLGDRTMEGLTILGVDNSFFNLFDYPVIESSDSQLIQKSGIVLSEALATNLFRHPPFCNRTITLQVDSNRFELTVTGILGDPGENSQLKFDALVLGNSFTKQWGGIAFILLEPNASPNELLAKVNASKDIPTLIGPGQCQFQLEPFVNTYFNETNVQPYEQSGHQFLVQVSWLVVFLINLAASFNFINLLVIGLMKRSRELGVRKLMGASKSLLGWTLASEVGAYIISSILISIGISQVLFPLFSSSFNTPLTFSYLLHLKVIGGITGLSLLIASLSIAYLGRYVWRLKVIHLIDTSASLKVRINRLLVTAQFIITVAMLVAATVVISQMNYLRNKPLGFNRELLELSKPSGDSSDNLKLLKAQLLEHPEITAAALSTGNPISGNWMVRNELPDGTFYSPMMMSGDEDLLETLHLELVKGKGYTPDGPSGSVVNETLVRQLKINDPIGAIIPGTEDKIIGIVKDFNVVSLKTEIPPYIIDHSSFQLENLLVDISGHSLAKLIPIIEGAWAKVYPHQPFKYKLISDELMKKHQQDEAFFEVIGSFTLASVIISCFGLFGITAYTTMRRTKEIGIRKVLGASVAQVLLLLSKDSTKRILISSVIAFPLAIYFMKEWLSTFVYHIDISWWMVVLPVAGLLTLATVTACAQGLSTSLQNPVNTLRSE